MAKILQHRHGKQTARAVFLPAEWIDSISITSLRFAKKFCFPFRIKRFYSYIWKLKAES
jgi:hypothetical protein